MTQDQPGVKRSCASQDWDRRRFLSTSALGLVAVGATGTLSACSGSGSNQATSTSATLASGASAPGASASAGAAKRGGTLRIGASGGSSTDTLDGQNPISNTDFVRSFQLFDQLVRLNNDAQPELALAQSITPNNTATQWTIRLVPGVVTHAGKPYTADDLLYSFNRIVKNKFPGAVGLGPINLKNSKVIDARTLRLAFDTPYSILVEALTLFQMMMVPRDFDPKKPVGTGPFKFQSFSPGVASTFVRNDDYWQSGKPYLDSIVTTNFSDETSQVSGLQAGQVDLVNYLSATSVNVLRGAGKKAVISKSGGWGPFTMRVDRKPFSDARVRQAMRLLVDRPQMLSNLFGGDGTLGNDVFGIYDKAFPNDLPQRVQDIPKAKSLLAAAGYSDLHVDLVTTPSAPGMVNAAQIFATQAGQAGIKVNVVQQTTTSYFANSYLKVGFSQDYWPTQPFLVSAGQDLAGPKAPFNADHFNDAHYDSLYKQAIRETNPSKQAALVHEMAHFDYDQGANIIPYFFPTIEAMGSNVQGNMESKTGYSPGGYYFQNLWMSS